jgi:hypothetical protein
MILTTTYALLLQHGACYDRYAHLRDALRSCRHRGAIPLSLILKINGYDDALWALQAVPRKQAAERDRIARLFACDCAERVLPLFERRYPEDGRPRATINIARRYAKGEATTEEMAAAWDAACGAAWATAGAAAWTAAWDAAEDAAGAAAWAAERAWQAKRLRKYLTGKIEA